MSCPDCPLLAGGTEMKCDQPINLRVDEDMFRKIGKLSNELDVTQAEIIRTCVRLALPQVKSHPFLIQLLPTQASISRNNG